MNTLSATISITADCPSFADLMIFLDGQYLGDFRFHHLETYRAQDYQGFVDRTINHLSFGKSGVELEWNGLDQIKLGVWNKDGAVRNGCLVLVVPASILMKPLQELISFRSSP